MKKVLIISSTPRKNGNSEKLCKQFKQGAKDSGNEVEFIRLADKKINYCIACYACKSLGKCFQNDDMNELAEKMKLADVIVLATPIYFFSMSGQLKVFIDRMVQNWKEINDKEIYLFATMTTTNLKFAEPVFEAIRGCTRDCFNNCKEVSALAVGGVTQINDIDNRIELQQAYNLGKNC